MSQERYLRKIEACKHLKISRATFDRIRRRDKTFPKPRKISPRVNVWVVEELDKWALRQAS